MRLIRSFGTGKSGAIAPLYALALLALIAIAGIGFDYGRLVAMQSELQNAADQAALAAVTQLDGRPGAQARARDAARSYFANQTRVANDGDGRAVIIADSGFQFFSDGEAGTPAASDEDSHAVQVSVDLREVFYALTPVVDAISSGGITASARAGLRKSVCNLPPIMVCVDHTNFSIPAETGEGLRMRWRSSNDVAALAPGNWGFLDVRGEKSSQYELGENQANYCAPLENVQTEPGFRNTEPVAMNTRFDMPTGKLTCEENGDFCPAQSVRKNWAIAYDATVVSPKQVLSVADVRALATCPATAPTSKKTGWTSFGDIAVIDRTLSDTFRMDSCFYDNTCSYLGDGTWDIDRYLAAHHPGVTRAAFANGTRYEIYKWELDNPGTRLAPKIVGFNPDKKPQAAGVNWRHAITYFCEYPQPQFAAALVPSSTQKDRRLLTVAAARCQSVAGRKEIDILGWMDIFLLEPSEPSTPDTIQAEIVGPALRPDNLNGYQYYGRDRAVLIR